MLRLTLTAVFAINPAILAYLLVGSKYAGLLPSVLPPGRRPTAQTSNGKI